MDLGVSQSVDVHELLRSTMVMFGHRIGMPGNVVVKHRGTISVQSAPGDTRVIVCLPLRAPAPDEHPTDTPGPAGIGSQHDS